MPVSGRCFPDPGVHKKASIELHRLARVCNDVRKGGQGVPDRLGESWSGMWREVGIFFKNFTGD